MNRVRRLTTFELAVVFVLLLVLLAIGGNKMLLVAEDAERAAVYGMLGNLQSQIHLKVSEHYIEGTLSQLGETRFQNPFLWSDPPPEAYGGELESTEALKAGYWYFDSDQSMIVYRARFNAQSVEETAQSDILRFKIKPTFDAADNKRIKGLKIELVSG